jgi:8-oxo-dGTP pyrophosphatase MutT (NUDIX family)
MSTPRPGALRARYVRRVTPADVGERVSIRSRVGDGPAVTDLVARLLAFDADAMLLVDRDGQLHVLDPARIVASRVVPPHPRLPPEPAVGTREQPLVREAARVLLLDPTDRVLLVSHVPAAGQRVWTAPGGGLRPGEDHETAARRELVEELGVALTPGPWVWSRREVFAFRGVWLDQSERWFLARVAALDPGRVPLDDPATDAARWWSVDELATTGDMPTPTGDMLAPAAFAQELARLLAEGPPATPRTIGR